MPPSQLDRPRAICRFTGVDAAILDVACHPVQCTGVEKLPFVRRRAGNDILINRERSPSLRPGCFAVLIGWCL